MRFGVTEQVAYSYFLPYLKYIGLQENASIYEFYHFVCVHNWEYLKNPDFAKRMWQYLAEKWSSDLGKKSTVKVNQTSAREVPSFFEFCIKEHPSIPCTDGKCYKASESIYSNSLEKIIGGLKNHLHVCSLKLSREVEDFIGIKRTLDLYACLEVINEIATKKPWDESRLNEVYKQLYNYIKTGLNVSDKALIDDWRSTGKLLASNDDFHPVNELIYLDTKLNLPPKRNSYIVKFIGSYKDEFESILVALQVKKVCFTDFKFIKQLEGNITNQELPDLIKQRARYLGIFLDNSKYQIFADAIIKKLEKIKFYNLSKLLLTYEPIDYKEAVNNHYDRSGNAIYYVGKWNSRKNVRIGEYLLEALGETLRSDTTIITSEKLLDFLDDPLSEFITYLKEIGRDIPDFLEIKDDNPCGYTYSPESPDLTSVETANNFSINQSGKEGNPETGKVGESWAQYFYRNHLGYTTVEDKRGNRELGYDFLCHEEVGKPKLKVEVKTRKSNYPVVGISANEWSKMVHSDNHNSYELLIVVHNGISPNLLLPEQCDPQRIEKIIRVKSAWLTLSKILCEMSDCFVQGKYIQSQLQGEEKQIDSLIGLELQQTGQANPITSNWKKLLESVSIQSVSNVLLNWQHLLKFKRDRNIELYRPISIDKFEKVG